MPATKEELAKALVDSVTFWVPAPAKPIEACPNTTMSVVALPDGFVLALLKYPNPPPPFPAKPCPAS